MGVFVLIEIKKKKNLNCSGMSDYFLWRYWGSLGTSCNSESLWIQTSTQRINKTDWFFLAGSLMFRDANARRSHLKWIKTKLNVRLAQRQRADLFKVNISADKISLQSYTEKVFFFNVWSGLEEG